jgi:hypothetical protein
LDDAPDVFVQNGLEVFGEVIFSDEDSLSSNDVSRYVLNRIMNRQVTAVRERVSRQSLSILFQKTMKDEPGHGCIGNLKYGDCSHRPIGLWHLIRHCIAR